MTIRNSLLTSFIIFVLLVVSMGMTLLIIANKYNDNLDKSMYHYSVMSTWRELDTYYGQQYRNISYFVILESDSEKDKFNTQTRLINSKYDEWIKTLPANSKEKEQLESWHKDFLTFNDVCKQILGPNRSANKFTYLELKIDPPGQRLKKQIETTITDQAQILKAIEDDVRKLNLASTQVSIWITIISLLSALLLSYFLFSSITKPLNMLQKFAQMVGEGKTDQRIQIKSPKEIVKLADSFNKMIDDLNASQMRILQMDRMASIGELAGGVAHEINNPLTGILGQSQLLLGKIPADNPYRPSVEKIESAAQRCRVIVRSLLDFARDKEYKFRVSSVPELIDGTLGLIETEINSKKIHIKRSFQDELPMISVSPGHIQQVFLNIITNSIHAMPNGGYLFIEATRYSGHIIVNFRDTGTGIKAEHLPHVFDPFFTTKDIGQGSGLGLSVSYGIIKKHRGEIIAKSDGENKGAEFTVKLPL
jgi:signal transduction histidine kinase